VTDFERYAAALQRADVAQPVLMLDVDALDANIQRIGNVADDIHQLRVVAKSLPVPALLHRVLTGWQTTRVMTFSVAMLRQIEAEIPGLDHLFGKPVPVAAARSLWGDDFGAQVGHRVTWLLDTDDRITQYARLAADLGIEVSVAVEVDVGLHRGGFTRETVGAALVRIAGERNLRFAGLMGYEPHLPVLPRALGIRAKAEKRFNDTYRSAVHSVQQVFGTDVAQNVIRNSAGSKTLADRARSPLFNDLSVGSLVVKPLDFASVGAPDVAPAMFIATPVLKVIDPLQVPGLGASMPVRWAAAGGARRGVYIHGGHWLAEPVYPPGFGYSATIGRSSNQELLVNRSELDVNVDDFVFLHPHQSEAVMLQFGPIAVISGDEVVEWWNPFAPTA
jgi:D-serine deaminase-like pyridoxal phosphate-dependent protein